MPCEIPVFSAVLFSAKRFKDFGKVNALFLLQFLSMWRIVFVKYILLIYKTYNYGNE